MVFLKGAFPVGESRDLLVWVTSAREQYCSESMVSPIRRFPARIKGSLMAREK